MSKISDINKQWSEISRLLAKCLSLSETSVDAFCGEIKAHADRIESSEYRTEATVPAMLLPHVTSIWHVDEAYTDEMGEPVLIRDSGEGPCLAQLIERAKRLEGMESVDIDLSDAIELLKERGCIEEADDGRYRLIDNVFRYGPGALLPEFMVLNIRRFLSTIVHNAESADENSRLQATAWLKTFPVRNLPRLKSFARDEGMQFLVSVDDYLMSEDTDNEENVHAGVGVYYFQLDDSQA